MRHAHALVAMRSTIRLQLAMRALALAPGDLHESDAQEKRTRAQRKKPCALPFLQEAMRAPLAKTWRVGTGRKKPCALPLLKHGVSGQVKRAAHQLTMANQIKGQGLVGARAGGIDDSCCWRDVPPGLSLPVSADGNAGQAVRDARVGVETNVPAAAVETETSQASRGGIVRVGVAMIGPAMGMDTDMVGASQAPVAGTRLVCGGGRWGEEGNTRIGEETASYLRLLVGRRGRRARRAAGRGGLESCRC